MSGRDLVAMSRALEESVVRSYGDPTKYQPRSNNASKAGHPCAYYLWAIRARWEDMPVTDRGLMGVFKVGREAEREIKRSLLAEGWKLTHDEVTFEDADLDLRGRMDFYLSHDTEPDWQEPIPTEFKSVASSYFGRIRSFDDCFNSPMSWVRLWPYQPLIYAYLAPEEWPVVGLLLRNKGNARVTAIIAEADVYFDRLVEMGERLALVNEALRTGDPPVPMTFDPVWCEDCNARALCPMMTSTSSGGSMVMLDDSAGIDALADSYFGGKDAKKESDAAWEEIKRHLTHYGAYDGTTGEIKTVVGERYRFTVKHHAKSSRLEVVPIVSDETGAGDDDEG